MVTLGKAVLPVPPMVLVAPLNVTVLLPPLRVPPLLVQFPATAMLPASVTVTLESIWTLPNVMAAVGVTVPDPSNCARLLASNVRAEVLTVKLFPNFMVSPAIVVNVPPDLLKPPLKSKIPAVVVFCIVPPLCVRSPVKVTVPVLVSDNVPVDQVFPAARVKEIDPDETLMVMVPLVPMVTDRQLWPNRRQRPASLSCFCCLG